MNCNDVRAKITEYFSGLLSDDPHARIRDHLAECLDCQDYAFSFSNLQNDLKRLGRRQPNFDMARTLNDALTRKQPGSSPFWRQPLFWIMALAVLILTVLYYAKSHSKARIPASSSVPSQEKKPLELLMLEQTLATLDRNPARNLNPEARRSEKTAEFRPPIRLNPVHLDYQISSPAKQDQIQNILSQFGEAVFQSALFRIQSVKVSELPDLIRKLEPLGMPLGSLKRLEALSDGPSDTRSVIISFVFLISDTAEAAPNFHHLHLQFARQNRSRYLEKLKDGYLLEYASDDLWVLELPGASWAGLLSDWSSVSDIRVDKIISSPSRPEEDVLAVIYAEDGWQ